MYALKNLHLRLTSRCNKRCAHCFARLDQNASDLSCSYWLSIVKTAQRMNVKSITLTGGEPLVYSDIDKFLEKIKDINVNFKIETNGLLLDNYIKYLENISNLQHVAISPGLEYKDEYMNDLLQRIKKYQDRNIRIKIQANIIDDDINYKLSWLERIADAGIPVRLMLGHNGLGSSSHIKNMSFESQVSIAQKYSGHKMIHCELPGILLGNKCKGCGWNRNRADILPDGRLTPCAAIAWNYPDFVLDYVDENNLAKVWKDNPYLMKIRKYKRDAFGGHCAKCEYFDDCQSSCVATSLGLKKSITAGYPLCSYISQRKQ